MLDYFARRSAFWLPEATFLLVLEAKQATDRQCVKTFQLQELKSFILKGLLSAAPAGCLYKLMESIDNLMLP